LEHNVATAQGARIKMNVILFSGGLDSTVLLAYLCKDEKPLAISFDYGQLNAKELDHAKRLTKHYGVEHRIIKLDNIQGLPSNEAFYIPFRNTVFLSWVCNLAETEHINKIYYACHHNDYDDYPDCRKEYVDHFNEILKLHGNLEIVAPFINFLKQDIVKLGIKLNVPLNKTWSCYLGNEKPCNNCPACKLRNEAMAQ